MSIITINNLETALNGVKAGLNEKIGYEAQELAEKQQAQVRKNINAAKIGTESFSKVVDEPFLSLTKDDFIMHDWSGDGSDIGYYYQGAGKLDWLKSWDDVTDFIIAIDGAPTTKSDVSDMLYVYEGDNFVDLYSNISISITNGYDLINGCESDNHYVWFYDDLSQFESFTFVAKHLVTKEGEIVLDQVVRPDWNQNDDLAADYIKNKPFYAYKEIQNIVDVVDVPFSNNSYFYSCDNISIQYPIELDKNYIVIWDGVEYECVAKEYDTHIYIGNPANDTSGALGYDNEVIDTGEPFVIGCFASDDYRVLNVRTNSKESTHTFSIVMVQDVLKPDEKYVVSMQSDWNMEDESKMSYIRNKPDLNAPKNYVILVDSVNGYNYVVEMKNGTLVSSCRWTDVNITTPPAQTEYINDEPFNPTGMVATALCEDGSSKIIDKYILPEPLVTYENASSFVIRFEEAGDVIDRTVSLTVVDAGASLSDFTYTIEDDRTYTLTGWNGTVNGEASTECIIPDYSRINL